MEPCAAFYDLMYIHENTTLQAHKPAQKMLRPGINTKIDLSVVICIKITQYEQISLQAWSALCKAEETIDDVTEFIRIKINIDCV